jgi:putative tryptophan/tyrosine transport system substrate-binding protein
MRRREFITLIGGAAIAWPRASAAQRGENVPRIGVLANEPWPPLDGLRDGFQQLGYIEGKTIELVYRYADGKSERYAELASELIRLQVAVIVTWGTPPSLAAMAATKVIPIIMTSGDPIAVGLVPGLAYPGGNVTGLSAQAAELEGKRLELIKGLLARFSRVAVLSNPTNPYCTVAVESARRGATALHVEIDVVEIAGERELDNAFVALSRLHPDALLVVADPFLAGRQTRIAHFLVENRIPSVYTFREQVVAGGLISYAANHYELFRRAAVLADKILKGTKPGDLPVEQPTKFELVINLKTAKALGLQIPDKLLALADEVIE